MHFHHLFDIESSIFRGSAPRPDAINEQIGGDELAAWLHERLIAAGIACDPVHAEDHGWDFEIKSGKRRYLVVCSCEFRKKGVSTSWHSVQVAQTKGAALIPDPVLVAVREVLSAAPDIRILTDEPRGRH
ncbi:hypothetical protein [Asaia prunellae]|uniref:hypothetical protein n=1 Tax=Asaia prunellae TaxID=610245 RepID=UPI00046F5AAB|nr:hypothetical protein [Asaia prunellae]